MVIVGGAAVGPQGVPGAVRRCGDDAGCQFGVAESVGVELELAGPLGGVRSVRWWAFCR